MEKDSNENWLSPHKPYSIAHRGASAYYQENTIESFFFAAKIGADFWEVDVQITKDKHLIVFHDSILDTGENIINLYLQEIRTKLPINTAPLFEDVLKLAIKLNVGIYLDIKARYVSDTLINLLKKYNYQKVIIGSFNIELIKELKKLDNSYPYAILVPSGFNPFEYAESADIIHLCWEKLENPEKLLDDNFFQKCEKKNQKVVIWHEENPERMKILRNLPVLGICSNQPELVNPIFKNNSEWPVEVVCHRGLNSLAPENSLASTLLALSLGFSHVEIDIRTTADKKLIINHDSTFNRTSNYKGYVNQTLSSSLDKIEIGKKFNSDFTNQQIPKLEEILEIVELYNGNLYAEIKDGKVDDVINTINKFNYLEKCFFWSENKNIMMDIINFNPNLNYMLRRQDFDTLNEIIENYNPKIIEYTLRDKLEELNILKQKNIKSMIAYMGNDEKVLKKIIQLKTDYVNLDQPILFSSFYSKEYS